MYQNYLIQMKNTKAINPEIMNKTTKLLGGLLITSNSDILRNGGHKSIRTS